MSLVSRQFFLVFLCCILSSSFAFARSSDETVAVVLGDSITIDEVSPTGEELNAVAKATGVSRDLAMSQFQHAQLTELIIKAVLDDYALQKGIEADPAMVKRFLEVFGESLAAQDDVPKEVGEDEELAKAFAEKKRAPKEVAEEQVKHWLTEKAMYEEFGGPVVFRSTAPQYPVGAYQKLLTQYAKQEKLIIRAPAFAGIFWRGFEPPYNAEIEPQNVDFSKPWWY